MALTADCSRHTLLNECSKRSAPCAWTNQNGWLVYGLTQGQCPWCHPHGDSGLEGRVQGGKPRGADTLERVMGGEGREKGEVKCVWPTLAHPRAPRTVLGRSSLVL